MGKSGQLTDDEILSIHKECQRGSFILDDINESCIGEFELLWMEITPKCNLSCIHCYAEAGPLRPLYESLSLEDWLRALQQAADLGCRRVQFTGGEPTLHPNLTDLIAFACELGFTKVEVYTNGTLFTETLKNSFLYHRVSLAFSVYSAQGDVHDAITQKKGSFSRTMASIQWAVGVGLPVRVAAIQMKANAGHFDQTRKMLREMGVTTFSASRIREIGRGSREEKAESQFRALCGRCWQGKLCLTSSGVIFPCVFSRFYTVGNLNQGLRNVLNGIKLRTFREIVRTMQWKQRWNAQTQTCSCDPNFSVPTPCEPDLPEPPCEPDLPEPPCEPDLPEPPCEPDFYPVGRPGGEEKGKECAGTVFHY